MVGKSSAQGDEGLSKCSARCAHSTGHWLVLATLTQFHAWRHRLLSAYTRSCKSNQYDTAHISKHLCASPHNYAPMLRGCAWPAKRHLCASPHNYASMLTMPACPS